MNRFAQTPPEERAVFIKEAAARLGVHPVIVEKDFWVTWTLARLFEEPSYRPALVFKGGTSLSKVFGVINRFSEDIDLSISPVLLGHNEAFLDDAPSSSKRRKRMQEIEHLCAASVEKKFKPTLELAFRKLLGAPETQGDWLEYSLDPASKSPTLLFSYPQTVSMAVSYIAQSVKIEFGSLTDQQPKGMHVIRPILGSVFPEDFEDFRSEVVALELERTFWEKATILHAEFHRPADQPIRDRFARHYSDLAALWLHPNGRSAAARLDLFERVVTHKRRYFASSWANYESAIPGSLRLVPPVARMDQLSEDYDKMAVMFLSTPPPFAEICRVVRDAEIAINHS